MSKERLSKKDHKERRNKNGRLIWYHRTFRERTKRQEREKIVQECDFGEYMRMEILKKEVNTEEDACEGNMNKEKIERKWENKNKVLLD